MADDLWGELAPPVVAPTTVADVADDPPKPPKPPKPPYPNPMVTRYGAGPDGATCGDCVHLLRESGYERAYIKCRLRGMTHGRATDHRVGWPACAWHMRRGAVKVGQSHTLPLLRDLGLPMAQATHQQTCPNCGRLLAFTIGRTHYGAPSRYEFDAEVARCVEWTPQRVIASER